MWALGVMLFTMLFGGFPFYDDDPKKLFCKIKSGNFHFPPGNDDAESMNVSGFETSDGRFGRGVSSTPRGLRSPPPTSHAVSQDVLRLVRGMLYLDPASRLTAEEALDLVESIVATWQRLDAPPSSIQVVPVFVPKDNQSEESFALANQVVPPANVDEEEDEEKRRDRSPLRQKYREPSYPSARQPMSSIHRPNLFSSSSTSIPSSSSLSLQGAGSREGGGRGGDARQLDMSGMDGDVAILDLRTSLQ